MRMEVIIKVRVNYYNSEGYCEGETFEGRWK